MVEPELTADKENEVLSDYFAWRVSSGVLTLNLRWAKLIQAGRHDEADRLYEALMPCLFRRAMEHQKHWDEAWPSKK